MPKHGGRILVESLDTTGTRNHVGRKEIVNNQPSRCVSDQSSGLIWGKGKPAAIIPRVGGNNIRRSEYNVHRSVDRDVREHIPRLSVYNSDGGERLVVERVGRNVLNMVVQKGYHQMSDRA
jgi:hypothetical protein